MAALTNKLTANHGKSKKVSGPQASNGGYEKASTTRVDTMREEKTGLHVSNDGSQLAKGGSEKRKGRSLRLV